MHVNRCCNSWKQKCDQERNQAEFKNKDFIMEIQSMWNEKANVIPVIIGATGTTSNSLTQYLSNIPGKDDIKELQKPAILGTACILREVLT